MDVPDLLANALLRSPGKPCVAERERSLTYAEVDARATALAHAFAARGLEPGARVALLALNELEYLEIQVAAQRARVILVPLNYRLAAAELAAQLSDCEPELLIHGPGFAEVAEEVGPELIWHLGSGGCGTPYDDQLGEPGPPPAPPALRGEDICTILYTSGTTGHAKGAMVSNRGLLASLSVPALEIGVKPGDTFVLPLPMFHVASHMAYAFVYRGATLALLRSFDAAAAIEALARHRATHTVLVPTMLGRVAELLERDPRQLDDLRLLVYGGSPISPDLLRRAIRALGCEFYQGYGLTEAFSATVLRPEDHDPDGAPKLLASAGRDALSYRLAILDPYGAELPAGELGEIAIRGPAVMEGYWNAPEATAAVMRDGWFHTGDLGYRAPGGFVYLTDRLKDVIVSGGENVYSREVEDALYSHGAVLEAAVIGIPSPEWGEAVHGVVVLREGRSAQSAELIAHCRQVLAGYKAPKSIDVVDDLPKNAAGKILKRALRDSHWAGNARAIG
jgi:acyl-CoA synthetase (AMP-forming)/AMP-acid ligase II